MEKTKKNEKVKVLGVRWREGPKTTKEERRRKRKREEEKKEKQKGFRILFTPNLCNAQVNLK